MLTLLHRLFARRWFHAETGEEVDAIFRPGPCWWLKKSIQPTGRKD